jgi:DUF1009 family protein
VHAAKAAGVRGIAVVAGEAIGLQRAEMIAQADHEGMFITGLRVAMPMGDISPPEFTSITCCGRHQPAAKDLTDVLRGGETVQRLAAFATGEAAAVVRGHVLGVSAIEGPLGLLDRVSSLGQWGLQRVQKRRGACVVRLNASADMATLETVLDRVATAGFAGLGLVTTDPAGVSSSLIRRADAQNVFLVAIKPASPASVSHDGR